MKIERITQAAERVEKRKKLLAGLEKAENISALNGGLYFAGYQGQSIKEFIYSVGLTYSDDEVVEMFRHWALERVKGELEMVDRQLIELGVEL